MRKFVAACSLAAVVAMMAVPARAAVNIGVAGPEAALTGFATPNIVLSQAAPATFLQLDLLAPHDLTEKPEGSPSTYLPKFYSPRGAPMGQYPLTFRGTVAPGDYRFICTIHPNMVGTATVV